MIDLARRGATVLPLPAPPQDPFEMLVTAHPFNDYCAGSGRGFRTARGILGPARLPISRCPECGDELTWYSYA